MEARSFDEPVAGIAGSPATPDTGAPGSISGIEQEFGVWRDGRQVPFAPLLGAVLPRARARGFGEDPLARVRGDGAVWTADGPHAEIATPPRPLAVGIAGRLAADTLHQREMLLRRLRTVGAGAGGFFELRGYSTHINAFCRAADPWAVVRRFGALYGPAVMLIADRRDSPGLLVRPRPDRLEIGTEYLETRDDVVAAALVVLSAAIECWNAVAAGSRWGGEAEPPDGFRALDGAGFRSTWQRPGIFIDRAAFGDDLYREGRMARLRLAKGGTERAGARLEAAWARLRPIASTIATAEELAAVDTRIDGTVRLPSEREAPLEPPVHRGHRTPTVAAGPNVELLRHLRHGALEVEPAVLDWDASLMRIRHPGGIAYARVPRDESARFAAMVRGGGLEPALETRVAIGGPPAVTSPDDRTPGLFDLLAPTREEANRLRGAQRSRGPGGSGLGGAHPGSIASLATSAAFAARKATIELTPMSSGRWHLPGLRWFWAGGAAILITLLVGWFAFGGQVPGTGAPEPTASPAATASCPAGFSGLACPNASPSTSPGASELPGRSATSTESPSASPSASACPVGAICPSGSPGPSATPCPVGVQCGAPTPTPRQSPLPTQRPAPRPTPRPTPSPTFCDPAFQPC